MKSAAMPLEDWTPTSISSSTETDPPANSAPSVESSDQFILTRSPSGTGYVLERVSRATSAMSSTRSVTSTPSFKVSKVHFRKPFKGLAAALKAWRATHRTLVRTREELDFCHSTQRQMHIQIRVDRLLSVLSTIELDLKGDPRFRNRSLHWDSHLLSAASYH